VTTEGLALADVVEVRVYGDVVGLEGIDVRVVAGLEVDEVT
jgi:hypothetical protein